MKTIMNPSACQPLSTVYMATSVVTGKSYIGITEKNFDKYKAIHLRNAMRNQDHDGRPFYRALRKHGTHAFEWRKLFYGKCHRNKLTSMEIFFIEYYNTYRNGYNATPGGDGALSGCSHHMFGKSHSIEVRQRLSESLSGRTIPHDVRTKISNTLKQKSWLNTVKGTAHPFFNKTHSPEYRNALSSRMSGMENPCASKYLLMAPNGQRIGANGSLRNVCRRYNISYQKMRRFISKGKIPASNHRQTKESSNCTDWEILSV